MSLPVLGLAMPWTGGAALEQEELDASAVFSHGDHVPKAWWKIDAQRPGDLGTRRAEEAFMDCRGCHPMDGGSALQYIDEYTTLCNACHIAGLRDYEGQPQLRSANNGSRPFPHTDHGSLECADCHSPKLDIGVSEDTDVLLIPNVTDAGYCFRCHGPEATDDKVGPGWAEVLLSGRENKVSMGEFSHLTHQGVGGTPGRNNCTSCHVISELGQSFGLLSMATTDCATTCHSGWVFEPIVSERTTTLLGTFSHRVHNSGSQSPLTCTDCHNLDSIGGSFSVKAVANAQASLCSDCHNETGAGPTVSRHGAEFFQECSKCHQVDPDGDLVAWDEFRSPYSATSLGSDEPSTFMIAAKNHDLEVEQTGDCIECHKDWKEAEIKSAAPFDHASHLAPIADPAEASSMCMDCHTWDLTIGERQVTSLLDQALSNLDRSCQECHTTTPIPVKVATHTAPGFSHGRHMGATLNARSMACTDCHMDGVTEPSNVGLKIDCTQCHGHQDPQVQVIAPGDFSHTDAQACVTCHTSGFPGPLHQLSESVRTIGIKSAPKHTKDASEDCMACHSSMPSAEGEVAYLRARDSRLTSRRILNENRPVASPHRGIDIAREARTRAALSLDFPGLQGAVPGQNRNFGVIGGMTMTAKGGPYAYSGDYCLHCHWNTVDEFDSFKQIAFEKGEFDGFASRSRRQALESKSADDEGSAPWRVGLPGIRAVVSSQ